LIEHTFWDALGELVEAAEDFGAFRNLGDAQYETQKRDTVERHIKSLVGAAKKLLSFLAVRSIRCHLYEAHEYYTLIDELGTILGQFSEEYHGD